MTTTPLPYFFDEAARQSKAKQPGEREKALNFTLDDLGWLNTVYKATDEARKTDEKPMHVSRLMLEIKDKPAIPLAGAFAMSRPNNGEVMLYTPWKGLIKFADMADLESRLKEWLEQDSARHELLRFLSKEQRSTLRGDTTPNISTQAIAGAVFEDQKLILERNQNQNIRSMLVELLRMPSLQSMLDETLNNALLKPFPGLDQRQTRLDSFIETVSAIDNSAYKQTLSSLPLSDALLHYYLNNQWPAGDSRTFSHPGHRVSSDDDNQKWERAVKEVAQSLTPHLQSLIETFWNTPINHGESRSNFFTECLRDTFHLRLLLQRQEGVLTTEEYLRLIQVSLAAATNNPLRIEKVQVGAPFKHYVELAGSLMIGSTDTLGFLYTQSRGIDATSDLPAVSKILLEMLTSEGHEDILLNYMSLDEHRTFLSMEPNERVITGVPVVGSVFEQLMADILDKQLQNLRHALRRYRESEGNLDLHALLDNALDVRGMIDDRLLAADAEGRWSTQAEQRWSAQPATVRAESAKEQLTLLSAAEQALEQHLDNHPSLPATTITFDDAQRTVESSLKTLQAAFTHTLSTALHSELKLRTVARTLGAMEQAIIKTVLDTPMGLQRAALNGFLPDVFSLALKAGDLADPFKLASCFVLTERGGLDPNHSGIAIAWTPALGFESFPSLAPLLTEFGKRLNDHDARSFLLENLSLGERLPGRTWTLAPLQRIDQHFIEHIQQPYVHLDKDSITAALASKLPASILTSLLNRMALRQPMSGLRRAKEIALSMTTQQKLPAWLAKASLDDLVQHAELLQQYLDNASEDKDYLTGLRSLARTAHHELKKQLKADGFDIDPDKIQIKPRRMFEASLSTLTDFALIHLKDLDQVRFDLESLDNIQIPKGLDEAYIKGLIRKLNPGQHHQSIIAAAFADTDSEAALRKKRFYAQLPWQLMLYAHTEKLLERLSATGFDLIRQVMDMPDAIARAAIDGADAIIRPLELAGIASEQTIKVPGTWLIGKRGTTSGKQVLIAPCCPTHGVKEYEDENLLLNELKDQGALRDWVLNSLSPSDRALCKAQLTTDSANSRKISLASNPVKGNLFKQLLDDNAALLTRLLGCQSNNDAQEEWATIKHVLGEDLEQASSFVMGKLAYPITAWRSYRDFKQSADNLQEHRWGAAMKAFINGLAQLATMRRSMETRTPVASTESSPAPEVTGTRIKWQDINIMAPDRARLKKHESTDIDLGSMILDSALGLYSHPTTQKKYAPVEGKVYPVAQCDKRWRISDDKSHGPYLRQNDAKQWMLDKTTVPRFGLINRIGTAISIWAGMNVEAEGMSEIRSLFPVKARMIDEALDLATRYAWNSFRNLQLLRTSGSRFTPVHQIITEFLDVPTIMPQHLDKLEKVVQDMFAALLDPTLRRPGSRRFAIGKVLENSDNVFGLTIPKDPARRIYLAEKFFLSGFDHYRNYLKDAAFPIRAHSRAATLLHELSHIVHDTVDIAYLDSCRPFAELIETTTLRAVELKSALTDMQSRSLSTKTPLNELFASYDPFTDAWEDLGDTSDENTDDIKQHILKRTGQKKLNDARRVFMQNSLIRLAVLLDNADSVTWLITHLGRELHTNTP